MMACAARKAIRGSESVTVMVIRLVFGTTAVSMVPSKEEMSVSCMMVLRMMELFSSSVNSPARLLVEDRLEYTDVELPRVVTTKVVVVR